MTDLLAPLRQPELGPNGVDIDAAIRHERRRARRIRVLTTGGAAGLVAAALGGTALLAPTAREPVAAGCVVTKLPLPAGVKQVVGPRMDSTGRYVVGREKLGGTPPKPGRVIMWDRGKPRILSAPTGDPHRVVTVNARGVVVGNDSDGAWRYENGKIMWLARPKRLPLPPVGTPDPPDGAVQALGINDAGDISGNLHDTAGQRSWPVLWPANALGDPVILPVPMLGPGKLHGGAAWDIAADGTLVGSSFWRDPAAGAHPGKSVAMTWRRDGAPEILPAPVAGLNYEATKVRAGRVLGHAHPPGGQALPLDRGFQWLLPSREGRELPAGVLGSDINGSHVIVGFKYGPGRDSTEARLRGTPVLVRGGAVVALPGIAGMLHGTATGIAEDGTIIGGLSDGKADTRTPVIWRGC